MALAGLITSSLVEFPGPNLVAFGGAIHYDLIHFLFLILRFKMRTIYCTSVITRVCAY